MRKLVLAALPLVIVLAACGGDAEIVAPASLRQAMHRFAVDALGDDDSRDGDTAAD